MAVPLGIKDRDWLKVLRRDMNSAWNGDDATGIENQPDTIYGEALQSTNSANTGYDLLISAGASAASVPDTTLLNNGAEVPTGKTFNVVDPQGLLIGGVSIRSQLSANAATHFYAAGYVPDSATTGSDTIGIANTIWLSEVFVPTGVTLTGVSFLIGSVGGTDKAIVTLYDSAGNLLANSATAGVTVGTAATFQRIPFTAPIVVNGPGLYYVGVQTNGTTARVRTSSFGNHNAGSVSQTFGTPASITPPTTYTASTGPVSMTY